MKNAVLFISLLLLLFLPFPLLASAKAGEAIDCLMCHSNLTEAPVVHGPVKAGGCPICHAVEKKGNMSAPKSGKKLPDGHPEVKIPESSKINETCLVCHSSLGDAYKKSKFKHPALEVAGCPTCHAPHNSKYKHLLKIDPAGPELCLKCHTDIMEKFKAQKFQHPALLMGDSCLNCHSPHFSKQEHLLKSDGKTICFACHVDMKESLAKNANRHPPVVMGECIQCHMGHGGNRERFLREEYTKEFYGKFSENKYQLCFQCHNPALVVTEKTLSATNFRNGDRNLHHFHVIEHRKGLSCSACHEVHATAGPKLIPSWVPFGNLQLPIQFNKTANGGSCLTACHKAKQYDRVKAVINDQGK